MSTPPPPSSQQPRDPHLIALKVLRSTRPALVPPSTLPYVDGAGARAFGALEDAHAAGGGAGGGGGGGLLSLPREFGSIYLGETFSAVLSLSNDLAPPPSSLSSPAGTGGFTAHGAVLRVEMHTGLPPAPGPQAGQAQAGPANKILLATVPPAPPAEGAEGHSLSPGESTETTVSHELKELGVHALVATVSYAQEVLVPPADGGGGAGERRIINRSFRKVYKFTVLNPLSVRTKAHAPPPPFPSSTAPQCATSSLSPLLRNALFLEVQVHNHHVSALWFERMRFEALEGLELVGGAGGEGGVGEEEGGETGSDELSGNARGRGRAKV
ncbi:hypothetical protein JCM10207_003808 [Rhodosporidiobolus poonsookiae]